MKELFRLIIETLKVIFVFNNKYIIKLIGIVIFIIITFILIYIMYIIFFYGLEPLVEVR